jgi:DNA-binding HxlR family transcriptional regulator
LKERAQKSYTYQMVTKQTSELEQTSELFQFHETLTQAEDRLAREVLERITARWSLSVMRILAQANGPLRFSRVLERVEGISQKALTQTLRTLEREGLITRTLYPQVPPRVEYELTTLGREILAPVASLWRWIAGKLPDIAAAQALRRDL